MQTKEARIVVRSSASIFVLDREERGSCPGFESACRQHFSSSDLRDRLWDKTILDRRHRNKKPMCDVGCRWSSAPGKRTKRCGRALLTNREKGGYTTNQVWARNSIKGWTPQSEAIAEWHGAKNKKKGMMPLSHIYEKQLHAKIDSKSW